MSEEWILFFSIFLGILAGGIVGALALKFSDSVSAFFKRKRLIKSIRIELSYNLARLTILEGEFIDDLKLSLSFDIFLSDQSKVFLEMKKDFYNMYLNDFFLLKNINVIDDLVAIYDFEYINNIFKFHYCDLITAIGRNEPTSNRSRNIKKLIKVMKGAIEDTIQKIEKVIDDLNKIDRQNILKFWFGKNR